MADVKQELDDRIAFAKQLHSKAVTGMGDVETLFKGEYDLPKDVADNTIHPYRPARPRAIVAKMLALLSVRAKMQNQVVPKREGQAEETLCTRLEEYLTGYQWRIQTEKNQPVFRHAVQWGLLRGKVVLVAQYVPRFVDSDYFPIRTLAPDPKTVWEVPGENGVMYFVRESSRYVLELSRELDKKIAWEEGGGAAGETGRWTRPSTFGVKKGTDECTVVEYWDGEYYAVQIDDELVLPPTEHGYGFCPIAVTYLEDTPFPEMEWKGQSILAPIQDAIKNQAILMAKMGDAVSLYFYPHVFVVTPDGRGGWIHPQAGEWVPLPPDSKPTVFAPSPNLPVLSAYFQSLQGDINLMTLPDIAWGMEAGGSDKSGFALSQVLGQVMDRIQDKKENLQFCFGNHFGQVLRLTSAFSDRAEGGKFDVMVLDARSKKRLLSIGADEIAEHYQVLTAITPTLPTEKLAMIQQMEKLRAPSPLSALPLVDDKSLREMYPEIFEELDQINERVDAEYWRKKLPEIEQWEQDEFLEEWRKRHPPHGTKGMDLSKLSKPQLVQMMKLMEMMLGNPEAFQQALAGMGGPPQYGVDSQQSTVASEGQGGMLPPQMLPPQMQGGGGVNPGLAAEQMGRALRPPGA